MAPGSAPEPGPKMVCAAQLLDEIKIQSQRQFYEISVVKFLHGKNLITITIGTSLLITSPTILVHGSSKSEGSISSQSLAHFSKSILKIWPFVARIVIAAGLPRNSPIKLMCLPNCEFTAKNNEFQLTLQFAINN